MTDTSFDTPFFLCFPELDPRAVRTGMPIDAFFFDPGAPDNASPRSWKPANLPLAEDTTRAFLRESARFAQEHAKSGTGLSAGTMHREDFYAQTSLAIRARLTQAADPEESARNRAVQAQQVLLLAWQLEQQALEIREMQQAVHEGLDDLSKALGVDEADDGPFSPGGLNLADDDARELPWRMILEAMLHFAPPWAILATGNEGVRTVFEEWPDAPAGLVPAGASRIISPLLDSGAGRLVHGPGWRLAGRTRCPADKPWLETPRSVLLLAPHGQNPPAAS